VPKHLYVNRDVALTHSAFCRGALAMKPRTICGVHVVDVIVEDFGPLHDAGEVIELDTMRQFFAFLQNMETASLIVRTRRGLAELEMDFAAGQQQIAGDLSASSVMSVMASEYSDQRGTLLRSLKSAEHTVKELGLDEDGTMKFLLLAEMLDCPEAHQVLLHYIASDFQQFSALPQWKNPLLGANTFRKLMELVPASEVAAAKAPQLPGKVEIYGYNQIQGTTRAAEIAASAPPAPELMLSTSPSKTVAAAIKDRLRSDAQQKPAQTQPVTKPHMVKRSTVRLRERERALAELRDKFYDSTTIDDSVLDFPHGPKSERFEANIPEPLAVSTSAPLEAPQASYPAYFNTAVARKKAASKVEPRYNKSPPRALPAVESEEEEAILSPQGPPVATEKARLLATVGAAEVLGMKEQLCLLLNSVDHRMEDIFCTADSIQNEGEAVEEGINLVKDLQESLKEIPEAMLADGNDAVMGNARPLADTTYPIAQKLTSGADAIRSHHNLFSQFQFKCLGLKDVLAKVIDRAENVAGPDLLDQYRKDTAMTGFEKSKTVTKPRVQGIKGKTRRLGSTVRNQMIG